MIIESSLGGYMARIVMTRTLVFFGCFLFSGALWAYGGGGGTSTACKKPKFSDFDPPHLAALAPESSFSFVANEHTTVSSLAVRLRKYRFQFKRWLKDGVCRLPGNYPRDLRVVMRV